MVSCSFFRFFNLPKLILMVGLSVATVMAIMDYRFHYQFSFDWDVEYTTHNTIEGWRVKESKEPLLPNGELLTHVRTPDKNNTQWMVLDNTALLPTFDFSESDAQIKQALKFDDALYEARDSAIEFKTSEGRVARVYAHKTPWYQLGGEFWLHKGTYLLFALVISILCVLYENSQKKENPADALSVKLLCVLFLFSGFSVVFPNSSANRQMGMPADYVWWRFCINMFAIQVTSMLYLHLIMREPIHLLRHTSKLWKGIIWVVMIVNYLVCSHLVWALFSQQENLVETLHLAKPVSLFGFVFFTVFQFIKTRSSDVKVLDRLSFDVVIKCVALILIFYSLFGFLIKQYWLSLAYKPSVMLAIMGVLVALALLVIIFRHYIYKVFNWWWVFNSIALGGITILIGLMMSSNYGRQYELMPSLISILIGVSLGFLVSFFYQFKEAKKGVYSLNRASSSLKKISSLKPDDVEYWPEQKNIFQAALNTQQAKIIEVMPDTLELINENEQLRAHILGQKGVLLSHPDNNKRLFNENDLKTVALLRDLSTGPQREHQAYVQGEKRTRQQVAHDLHDDIGGRLHQLAHGGSEDTYKYAQKTLEQLRTLTHALHQEAQPMSEFLYDVRYEMQRYGQTYPVDLAFNLSCDPDLEKDSLSANAMVQFKSIISELCRNALQHQDTKNMHVTVSVESDVSEITVENDGAPTKVKDWVAGVGTVSIKRRAHQLGGHAIWKEKNAGGVLACVTFNTSTWLNS